MPEGLLIAACFFGPLAFGGVEPWARSALEAGLLLLGGVCALRPVLLPSALYKSLLPAIAALLLLGIAQWAVSIPVNHPRLIVPSAVSSHASAHALLLWAAYAALLACVPQVLDSPARLRRFAWAVFLLGVVVSIIGIIQLANGNRAYYNLRPVRQGSPFGPYVNYNHAGNLLVMSGLVGWGLFLSRIMPAHGRWNLSRVSDLVATQGLIFFMLAILFYAVALTSSRGSVVALVAAVSVLSALRVAPGRFWLRVAGAAGLACFLAWYLVSLCAHHPQKSTFMDFAVTSRFSMWRSGFAVFRDYPWTGVGPGGVLAAFAPYKEAALKDYVIDHVHNNWLELLLQSGLIGAGAIAGGLCLFAASLRSRWKRIESNEQRWLVWGFAAAATAFLIHSTMEFSFEIPANAVLFLAILGALDGLSRDPRGFSSVFYRPPSWLRGLFCLPILAAWVAVVKPAVAQWYLFQADSTETELRKDLLLSRAVAWDPCPAYLNKLSRTNLRLAEAHPEETRRFLRRALEHSEQALRMEAGNPSARSLQSYVLWKLDRRNDSLYYR